MAAKLDERIARASRSSSSSSVPDSSASKPGSAPCSPVVRAAADTRRKILVGAIVLAKVEQGELDAGLLRGWLDQSLTRKDDRELFGL